MTKVGSYSLLLFLIGITFFLSLSLGVVTINPFQILLSKEPDFQRIIIFEIRFPRGLMAILIGGSLGMAGSAVQGYFRNPLAEPSILGISSGAMLFTVISIVTFSFPTFSFLTYYLSNISAVFGAILVMLLIYFISGKLGNSHSQNLLLSGIAISALCGGIALLFVQISTNQQLRSITFWSMGSLAGVTWDILLSFIPFCSIPTVLLIFQHKKLDVLLLGETEAKLLGINLKGLKITLLASITMLVGGSVSLCGVIGFVGLLAPHLARLIFGQKHLDLLIGAGLIGSLLVLISDLLARTLFQPIELPIGIITTCIGVPFFLYFLIRKKSIIL